MGLLTRGTHVLIRRGRKSVQFDFADIELRGTETTLRQIETRITNLLNAAMAPFVVAIHIDRLVPLKYHVLLGPPGLSPQRDWWKRAFA